MNVSQLSISVEGESGRVIMDDPSTGLAALTSAGLAAENGPVICLELPDHPGGACNRL